MGYSPFRATGLTHHNAGRSFKGYTLFNPLGTQYVILLNMQGQIVHKWVFDDITPGYARLLDNGNLLLQSVEKSLAPEGPRLEHHTADIPITTRVGHLGANASLLREVDWDNNTVWEYKNEVIHHDFSRLPNGNTVTVEWVDMPDEVARQVRGGIRSRKRNLAPMLGDEIIEIDPSGKEVWRSKIWQLQDPVKDAICFLEDRVEWSHINGLDVNADGQIVFSGRWNSRVGIVDRNSGDLIWSCGKDQLYHQHNPTWLKNGNVQIFDNGMHRPGSPRSRVVEVDPKTDKVEWEYTASPDVSFLSGHISGAERQENGNTLVCEGAAGRLFEITSSGEIVWEWINPFVGEMRGSPASWIFRAHRYSPEHPALAGRELDPAAHADMNRLYGLDS